MIRILLLNCLIFIIVGLQKQPSSDYYIAIKKHDLSKLWRESKLRMVDNDNVIIDFPEPLGYIGDDYHRFYIHYNSVSKDLSNPYIYHVTGKTRVNNNVCSFKGTITINKALLYKLSDDKRYKQGQVFCDIIFKEDSTQKGSGVIHGKLVTDWYLDKQGRLFYDTINANADSWCNNQCKAIWTSNFTHKSKKCNWGDFRIPDSKGLDIGAGEFGVSDKYVKNGWLNYHNSDMGNAKAKAEEKRKWWLNEQ
jgi:hypothetical protein